ncbi:MAG: peroxide stress protein YaaA [Candidatus Peribacteria bacterium]|nr:MAG: peroxide stress protein YaaA [Candidatus Peribacteria bacterium]
MSAIERYSGVMYDAIDYRGMSVSAQKFFSEHFLILSGMYGILRPDDMIGNYKLPIETKGLYQFWWDVIPEAISELQADYIINLLPLSYAKLI